jgi:hypothetical protein
LKKQGYLWYDIGSMTPQYSKVGWIGVLTGDLVASSDRSAADLARARRLIERIGPDLRRHVEPTADITSDWYRGDGWELAVRPGWLSLRAGLYARALLRGCLDGADTRVSIGVGLVDDPSRGAFIRSGRGLDALGRRMRMGFDADIGDEAGAWNAAMGVVDELIEERWTPKRSAAVVGALRGWTQARTGRLVRPRVSQATIGEHLDRAGWAGMKRMLVAFEDRWKEDTTR